MLEAHGPDVALEYLRAAQPDLVLADVLIATLGGFPFAVPSAGTVPPQTRFVFCAPAFLMAEARALAKAHGVAHVIAKPFDPAEVLDLVSAALAEPFPALQRADFPDKISVERQHASIIEKLRQRTARLEQLATQLEQRLTETGTQLETARSALQQEVSKRLWAEDELTRANQSLHEQAMRDVLTGLYNRRYLMESFERELRRARRGKEHLGVMIIDIDHFKSFNDTYGHAAGDEVLRSVAKFMLTLVRGEDILCRFGGEEFVLVQMKASAEAVLQRAEKFRQEIGNYEIIHDGRRLGPVTLSIGISMFPDHGDQTQTLLVAADTALYRAKHSGRNLVVMEPLPEETEQGGPVTAEPFRTGEVEQC